MKSSAAVFQVIPIWRSVDFIILLQHFFVSVLIMRPNLNTCTQYLDNDEILSIFMWLKVSPSEGRVAERWGEDGGGWEEERKGKREEHCVCVCFSVSTRRYFLCSALSFFISHPSVRGVGGRPCLERPHTFSLQKTIPGTAGCYRGVHYVLCGVI